MRLYATAMLAVALACAFAETASAQLFTQKAKKNTIEFNVGAVSSDAHYLDGEGGSRKSFDIGARYALYPLHGVLERMSFSVSLDYASPAKSKNFAYEGDNTRARERLIPFNFSVGYDILGSREEKDRFELTLRYGMAAVRNSLIYQVEYGYKDNWINACVYSEFVRPLGGCHGRWNMLGNAGVDARYFLKKETTALSKKVTGVYVGGGYTRFVGGMQKIAATIGFAF